MINNTLPKTPILLRGYISAFMGYIFLLQTYIVITLNRAMPSIKDMSDIMGGLLPPTQSLFSYGKYTIVLPILTLLLALDIVRRKVIPMKYALVSFIILILLTFFLQAWITEAAFAPIIEMSKSIVG